MKEDFEPCTGNACVQRISLTVELCKSPSIINQSYKAFFFFYDLENEF